MEILLVLLLLLESSAAAPPAASTPRPPPPPLVPPSTNTLNRRSPLGTNLAAVTDWTAGERAWRGAHDVQELSLALVAMKPGCSVAVGIEHPPLRLKTLAEYPFINHFKMARPWFPASASAWEDSSRPLSLDANGNVKALLPGQVCGCERAPPCKPANSAAPLPLFLPAPAVKLLGWFPTAPTNSTPQSQPCPAPPRPAPPQKRRA